MQVSISPAEHQNATVITLGDRSSILFACTSIVDSLQEEAVRSINVVNVLIEIHTTDCSHLLDGKFIIVS